MTITRASAKSRIRREGDLRNGGTAQTPCTTRSPTKRWEICRQFSSAPKSQHFRSSYFFFSSFPLFPFVVFLTFSSYWRPKCSIFGAAKCAFSSLGDVVGRAGPVPAISEHHCPGNDRRLGRRSRDRSMAGRTRSRRGSADQTRADYHGNEAWTQAADAVTARQPCLGPGASTGVHRAESAAKLLRPVEV